MKTLMVVLPVLACCSAYGFGGRVHITVNVLDSMTGAPIPNMKVHGGFRNSSPGWGIASKDNSDEKVTGDDGMCRLSGSTEAGHSCCIVRNNDGYYDSGWYSFDYDERSFFSLGRWMPDNVVVTVRLDRIVNPIPLYVRQAKGEHREKSLSYHKVFKRQQSLSATNDVPIVKNVLMAYDMVKGAWLPPHGDGVKADVQFLFNETVFGWKEGRGYSGTTMTKMYRTEASVLMPGEGNGIVEVPSRENAGIKLRIAPEAGYENGLTCWRGWFGDGTKTDRDKKRCYAFRIRTEYDDNGNIKSAYYGKIYDDFDLVNFEGVGFLYYLNPTPNDRNLEWDMKNNLCPKPGDIGGEPRP